MATHKEAVLKLLEGTGVEINGSNPWDIVVNNDGFYTRAIQERELGFGESYMDGWWDCDDLAEMINKLFLSKIYAKLKLSPDLLKLIFLATVTNRQSLKNAKQKIQDTYSVHQDVFQYTLGETMGYTCGYWKDTDDDSQAQINKFDLICKKLHLEKGMTLLDLGCGWGTFSKYAAETYGVDVTGVTLAGEQSDYATALNQDLKNVRIVNKDYRELTGKFDRITSIGMTEHIGPKNYRTFLQKQKALLTDDGIILQHTIGSNRSSKVSNAFIDKYIFPGGVIPSLKQLTKAKGDLIVEDIQNIGPDYDPTLVAWYNNFDRHYDKLKDKYDERFYRMWKFYLLVCAGTFRSRHLHLYQIVYRKGGALGVYESVR